ncbi:MAG: GIY-YIG nuclease family protein [Patescibacteria group bacterium]
MYYCYILLSSKSHIFYYGSTQNLGKRFELHESGSVESTKPHRPWKLVWYGAFSTMKEASDFERYLKSGSGRAFAYKRLISNALVKDVNGGRSGLPKLDLSRRSSKSEGGGA